LRVEASKDDSIRFQIYRLIHRIGLTCNSSLSIDEFETPSYSLRRRLNSLAYARGASIRLIGRNIDNKFVGLCL